MAAKAFNTIFLDWDSTLVGCEGLDELAVILGKDPKRVKEITAPLLLS